MQLAQGEKVAAILPVRELPAPPGVGGRRGGRKGRGRAPAGSGTFVFAATRRGLVKKTPLDAYARPRATGIIALSIEEGDSLIAARITDGRSHILLSTAQGMAIRFEESDVRSTGRAAYGVKGIALDEGDEVVSAESLPPVVEGAAASTILSVTANGYGKRSELSEYRTQTRGGKGIITIKATERNGPVVAAMPVVDADEVMLITNRGMLIRMPAGADQRHRAQHPGRPAHHAWSRARSRWPAWPASPRTSRWPVSPSRAAEPPPGRGREQADDRGARGASRLEPAGALVAALGRARDAGRGVQLRRRQARGRQRAPPPGAGRRRRSPPTGRSWASSATGPSRSGRPASG